MASLEIALDKRWPLEGGYQNYSTDGANFCGGQQIGTNLGISAQGYAAYYGHCPTIPELQALTHEQAAEIYDKKFWSVINGDKIKNQSVAELMFLYEIGNPSTISDLKANANKVYGSKVIPENDNAITDSETAIINSLDQAKFHEALKEWRRQFYYKIVSADPSKGMFLQGWLNGIEKYIYEPGAGSLQKKKVLVFSFWPELFYFWLYGFFSNRFQRFSKLSCQ